MRFDPRMKLRVDHPSRYDMGEQKNREDDADLINPPRLHQCLQNVLSVQKKGAANLVKCRLRTRIVMTCHGCV